jgi:hypothetical protein
MAFMKLKAGAVFIYILSILVSGFGALTGPKRSCHIAQLGNVKYRPTHLLISA